MHMADALISPAVAGAFWAVSAGAIACSSRRIESQGETGAPLAGVIAAFVFAAQMINFSIPGTGSSGHLGGGLLLAILLGKHRGFLAIASVLLVQSLFFADGGLLAYGCNVFNMGFIPAFILLPLYQMIVNGHTNRRRITTASFICAILGASLGAMCVILQTTLSGITALPPRFFLLAMLPIHIVIGSVEGIITGAIVLFVRNQLPEAYRDSNTWAPFPLKKLLISLTLFIAAVVSLFASSHPDGLEWSIQRLTGSPDVASVEKGSHLFFSHFQKITAFLPDYQFKHAAETATVVKMGTSVSGVVGALLTLLLVACIFLVLRKKSVAR